MAGHRLRGRRAGGEPVRTIIQETGLWSVRFLVLSLAIGPLVAETGWMWPSRLRRMIGLFGAAYAYIHLLAWMRQYAFDWGFLASEIALRAWLAIGFASVVLLAPLTATSLDAARRLLGSARWRRVHLLIYPALIAAWVHFLLSCRYAGVELAIEGLVIAAALASRARASRRANATT
jgi:sulfoxide reductase heme-binding subunit YedZ